MPSTHAIALEKAAKSCYEARLERIRLDMRLSEMVYDPWANLSEHQKENERVIAKETILSFLDALHENGVDVLSISKKNVIL